MRGAGGACELGSLGGKREFRGLALLDAGSLFGTQRRFRLALSLRLLLLRLDVLGLPAPRHSGPWITVDLDPFGPCGDLLLGHASNRRQPGVLIAFREIVQVLLA